jgi:acetolactate synthase-1/2/3 large subunit
MTGAQLIVRLLERQGVRIVAGIPGGANLPLYDALAESRQICHVLARHEQGAGFIAQGMARVTGRPEVCFATSGPGATNVLTALADAKLDSIPMVCITGQVPAGMIGTDAFQEVDTYGMSIPITKHNFLPRSADELAEVIPEAFRIAASGRPGPVLVDVPKDVQTQRVEVEALPAPGAADPPPVFSPNAIAQAAEMLNAAERPVLCLGGGVVHSGAASKAVELAETAGLPTTTTLMGLGAIPSDHSLALGMLGMHGARYTNLALDECDLFIAVGSRFDDRATGNVAAFCPEAKVIHIDIDTSELDKVKTAHVGIAGDARQVLESLLPLVRRDSRPAWKARVEALKQRHPLVTPGAEDPRTPYGLLREVSEALEDAIVATDVGQHQMWTAQAYPFCRPRRWLSSGGLGTMGFGLPAAIGAALASPNDTVVCFSGDGSLLMNIQELATAVEENVNLKLIVMDNRSLGLVRQQQSLFYGARIYAAEFRAETDFAAIARGFGMAAFELARSHNPSALLAYALGEPGPCLIHAPIDAQEDVYPMVPPGGANRHMIGGEICADSCS